MSDGTAEIESQAEAVTDHVHENSWSANLELSQHEERERVLADAVEAVEHTASGHHVNLVTHGEHGHPEGYLYDALDERFGDAVEWEFVDRCGCGGYVTRVYVER